jgi:hypothetical protein
MRFSTAGVPRPQTEGRRFGKNGFRRIRPRLAESRTAIEALELALKSSDDE